VVYVAALMLNEELVAGNRLLKDLPSVVYIGD
jgi:hypothetical protein